MDDKVDKIERTQDLLANGPLKELGNALIGVQKALETFNAKSETRHEAAMATMSGIDRRLTFVEARQGNVTVTK